MSVKIEQTRLTYPGLVSVKVVIPEDLPDAEALKAALDALSDAAQAASRQLNLLYAPLREAELAREASN